MRTEKEKAIRNEQAIHFQSVVQMNRVVWTAVGRKSDCFPTLDEGSVQLSLLQNSLPDSDENDIRIICQLH